MYPYQYKHTKVNQTLAISLYSVRLLSATLGRRANISRKLISLKDVFKAEVEEIDKRNSRELDAVEQREKERAYKTSLERAEIISGMMERENKGEVDESAALPIPTKPVERTNIPGPIEQESKVRIDEFGALPVFTKTPKMLITGKCTISKLDILY